MASILGILPSQLTELAIDLNAEPSESHPALLSTIDLIPFQKLRTFGFGEEYCRQLIMRVPGAKNWVSKMEKRGVYVCSDNELKIESDEE